MIPIRQLRLGDPSYWRHHYAVIIMSHTKAGFPIVKALLDLGMYVVAVSSNLKQCEMLRHHLTKQQERRFFTHQCDLHRIMSINTLILHLKTAADKMKLLLCIMPQIDDEEKRTIFNRSNTNLLQTVLEIDDMGVGCLCAIASRHVIDTNYSHMWTLRFHHDHPELAHDYLEYLLAMGEKAPCYLNVNLRRNNCRACACIKDN